MIYHFRELEFLEVLFSLRSEVINKLVLSGVQLKKEIIKGFWRGAKSPNSLDRQKQTAGSRNVLESNWASLD